MQTTHAGQVCGEHRQDVVVVWLSGEIDAETGPALQDAAAAVHAVLTQVGPAGLQVVVDVAQVSFMDSRGVAFLIHLVQACHPTRVQLRHLSSPVRFLMQVTHLHQILDIDPAEWTPTA